MWADNIAKQDLLGYQVHADLLQKIILDDDGFSCRKLDIDFALFWADFQRCMSIWIVLLCLMSILRSGRWTLVNNVAKPVLLVVLMKNVVAISI